MKVLIEAVGSPVWGTLLPYLRRVADKIVGLDIDPLAYGLYMVDRGYLVPRYSEPGCLHTILQICHSEKVELVFPSINEGLLKWSELREDLAKHGITVLISPPETVAICQDKWETYRFFVANHIPTPRTSLEHEYELIKPRIGRGGSGIRKVHPGEPVDMQGCISQEIVTGEEFSVDALCDLDGNIIYIVPRKRLVVESGLSVKGQVVHDPLIEQYVRQILMSARFVGPVHIQCFRTSHGISFTEINPRIAGGLSLSMAATENWFEVLINMLNGESVQPKPVKYGLVMMRYLSDCIIHESDVLAWSGQSVST